MTKEQFTRKYLEVQLRGMLIGSYETNDGLTDGERETFFNEAVARGFFLKNDGSGAAYGSFDEMLEDLKAGKRILNLKTPHKGAGYFAFPGDMNAVYAEFSATGARAEDQSAISFRTSFSRPRQELINEKSDLAAGEQPEVPGGLLSRMWNGIVKFFTGHSSETWKDYDRYQSELSMKNTLERRESEYESANGAKPGTPQDPFTAKLISADRAGRIARGEISAQEGMGEKNGDIEQQLKDQRHRDDAEYMRKADEIQRLDVNVYQDMFINNSHKYKSIDEALAAATKNYETENKNRLDLEAGRELETLQQQLAGSERKYTEFNWKRTADTSNLINNNAYQLRKFLNANSGNQEFKDRVSAAMKSLQDRCDAIESPFLISQDGAFHKSEIEIMLALKEMKIEGAEKFKPVCEMILEEAEAHRAKFFREAPKPLTDVAAAEESFKAGNASEEQLDLLLKQEDAIRIDINTKDEKPAVIGQHIMYESAEFDFDLERAGLKTEDPVKDKTLTLQMMRAQHEAIRAEKPVPFFFSNEEEIEQSRSEAFRLGFITKEQFDAKPEEQEFEEEIDPELERQLEEERLRAEEERRLAEERAQKLKEKERFIQNAASEDGAHNVIFNEYNRLSRLAEDYKGRDNTFMKALAGRAAETLDRALDAKVGLHKYDEKTASEDIACIIIFTECAKSPEFLKKFKSDPTTHTRDIVSNVKRTNMHRHLLAENPEVDAVFFRKNRVDEETKHLTTAALYRQVLQLDHERQQKESARNVENTLKTYSPEQQAIISNPELMLLLADRLKLQPELKGDKMAKEELQLQNDATKAMGYLYSDILMKPQGADDEIDMNALVENLTDVAVYQSLNNPDYRKAYLTLLGTSKLKGLDPRLSTAFEGRYREMVKEQINVSLAVPEIKADRTKLMELVFNEGSNLYTGILKRNLPKNFTFEVQNGTELDNNLKKKTALDNEFKEKVGTFGKKSMEDALRPRYEMVEQEKQVLEQIGKNFRNGTKEIKKEIDAEAKKAVSNPVK